SLLSREVWASAHSSICGPLKAGIASGSVRTATLGAYASKYSHASRAHRTAVAGPRGLIIRSAAETVRASSYATRRPRSPASRPCSAASTPSTRGRGRPLAGRDPASRLSGHTVRPMRARPSPSAIAISRSARLGVRASHSDRTRAIRSISPAATSARVTIAVPASTSTVVAIRAHMYSGASSGAMPPRSAASSPFETTCAPTGRRESANSIARVVEESFMGLGRRSEQVVQLREGELLGGLRLDRHAVDRDLEGVGPDVDRGQGVVVLHVRLAHLARRGDGQQLPFQPELAREAVVERGLRDEGVRQVGAVRVAEGGSHQDGLRRRDRRVRVAQRGPRDRAALDDEGGPHAKEPRIP